MKNILVIDGAINCVYDIFSATNDEFLEIFPKGTDVAFIDEVYQNGIKYNLDKIFDNIWKRRCRKEEVKGIHGTIFYDLEDKKIYYPTRKDEEAINPDGTKLR